ncbi:putative membrane protein [Paenibacillus aceris]|uniref:Membrane protein n=1 Tax=Paenibacillus aceris TaxID=869555 RepID=A0ABS4IAP8_9BACL|nr:putative membrane protein [Paenibacillus aceris]
MNKKKSIIYFILASFLFGGAIFLFQSICWTLFFLIFIGFILTIKISDERRSFGKQMFSACLGLFFFGWLAVLVILLIKIFISQLYYSLI